MTVRARRPSVLLSAVLSIALGSVAIARAEPPAPLSATAELKLHFDRVLSTVRTPSFRALDSSSQRDEIRRASGRLFNWSEMSSRALGAGWRDRSSSERRGFTRAFASLAEQAYLGPIERLTARGVPLEPVRYVAETVVGPETVVAATLMYPREMPVDFVMRRAGAWWEVCDVRINGVSAAENYAAQFRRVLGTASFEGLVDRMTTKATAVANDPALTSR